MKKVLTVGGAMYDIFTQYQDVETLRLCSDGRDESYLIMRAGRKIEVQELRYYCGGGATNSAVSFARAGCDVQAFFKVGKDQAGDFICHALNSNSVCTDYVVKTDEKQTGTSFIVPGPSGNRSVLVYRGANLTLTASELPEQAILNADQLYVTSLSGHASNVLLPLVTMAKKQNKSIAVNPGTSQLKAGVELFCKALPFIDVLIVNSYEAQLLMGSLIERKSAALLSEYDSARLPELLKRTVGSVASCFALPEFFKAIHNAGPSLIVVTNGSEGVYCSDKNAIFFHPSIATNIVSSIGAGDAFGSTFIASLLQKKSVENALRSGIINSASVIAHLGTQTGLLNAHELDRQVALLDSALLHKYACASR